MAWSEFPPFFLFFHSPAFSAKIFIDPPFSSSTRLKNIEETEKAKRVKAEERYEKKKMNNDEEHLVATRCEIILYFLRSVHRAATVHCSLQAKFAAKI